MQKIENRLYFCRSWEATTALVMLLVVGGISLEISSITEDSLVLPGVSFTVLCKSNEALKQCRFYLPWVQGAVSLTAKEGATSQYRYTGTGLENGDCGIFLTAVEDRMNGAIRCELQSPKDSLPVEKSMRLTVAKRPSDPKIQGNLGKCQKIPEINETCIVEKGRPKAAIVFTLGGKNVTSPLRIFDDEPNAVFTVYQRLGSDGVSWRDDGKMMRCQATHFAYDSKKFDERRLSVCFSPRIDNTSEIVAYDFLLGDKKFPMVERYARLGEKFELTLEVFANPQPVFVWLFDDVKLQEGDTNGDYAASIAKKAEGSGPTKWIVSLTINNLNEDDFGKEFRLSAKNGEDGEKEFIVKIRKQDGLGGGAIAGIIIAVLALLGLGLGGYAKLKKKWIFADKPKPASAPPSGPVQGSGDTAMESSLAGPKYDDSVPYADEEKPREPSEEVLLHDENRAKYYNK